MPAVQVYIGTTHIKYVARAILLKQCFPSYTLQARISFKLATPSLKQLQSGHGRAGKGREGQGRAQGSHRLVMYVGAAPHTPHGLRSHKAAPPVTGSSCSFPRPRNVLWTPQSLQQPLPAHRGVVWRGVAWCGVVWRGVAGACSATFLENQS